MKAIRRGIIAPLLKWSIEKSSNAKRRLMLSIHRLQLQRNGYGKGYVKWGAKRMAPTFSNLLDCDRFDCPTSPWHWATRWVLERAQLSGKEVVCDLGAGSTNYLVQAAYSTRAARAYLVDNHFLPSQQDLSPNIRCIQADISRLPLTGESVDVAISISVLEHLPVHRRLEAMREIERILKPGGRALFSIGNIMHASDEAQMLMQEMPFFTDRGSAIYLPIDLKAMGDVAPRLRLAATDELDYCPGYEKYDEDQLLHDPNLCTEAFIDYPELARHQAFEPVVTCEVGVMLLKH
jgi:SAM-dependent methyltransferase